MFMPRTKQFSGILLTEWFTLSTVHGDVISLSLTVVSDSKTIEEVITYGICTARLCL